MKKTLVVLLSVVCGAGNLVAQKLPVYLDESKSMEQRIEDALSRMTLDEKIAVIHAQSKFSSPGVKRLGAPRFQLPHRIRGANRHGRPRGEIAVVACRLKGEVFAEKL